MIQQIVDFVFATAIKSKQAPDYQQRRDELMKVCEWAQEYIQRDTTAEQKAGMRKQSPTEWVEWKQFRDTCLLECTCGKVVTAKSLHAHYGTQECINFHNTH